MTDKASSLFQFTGTEPSTPNDFTPEPSTPPVGTKKIRNYEELLNTPIPELPNTIVVQYEPGTILEDEVRKVASFLNMKYLWDGTYPSLSVIKESFSFLLEYGSEQLEELFTKVNDILENARGLPPFEVKINRVRSMDPQFIAACNLIFDVMDKRPQAAKLKSVGLTTGKFQNMLRQKMYRDFYGGLVDQVMDSTIWNEGRLALTRNVINGDLPSIKFAMELTDKFQAKSDFDPRVLTMMMVQILDIISKHVDGRTARVIADELETVAINSINTTSKEKI